MNHLQFFGNFGRGLKNSGLSRMR